MKPHLPLIERQPPTRLGARALAMAVILVVLAAAGMAYAMRLAAATVWGDG